jgi:heptosyltransferase I
VKILIVKLSSLGDIVHSLPVLSLLKQINPKPVIDWLVVDNFADLLEGWTDINAIHTVPRKNLQELIAKAFELRKENYDLIIDLQGLLKTALATATIGGKHRLGFEEPREKAASLFYTHKFDVSNIKHIVDQNIGLIRQYFDIKASKIDFGIRVDLPSNHPEQLLTNPLNICVIPSTTWESKLWPVEYWLELLSKYNNANIFLLGSKSDLCLLEAIARQVPNTKIIHNKKLKDLPKWFATMNYIIGVDTGPLHIAAASCYGMDNPPRILGVYGPTSGSRTGPYGFGVISYDEMFATKASHKRKIKTDNASMARISPDAVYNKINESFVNSN